MEEKFGVTTVSAKRITLLYCCRKPQKQRPTLKELAEQFIAQQRAEEILRMEFLRIQEENEEKLREEAEEERKILNKDASFVTTGEKDEGFKPVK